MGSLTKPRANVVSSRIRNLYQDHQERQRRQEMNRIEAEQKKLDQEEAARRDFGDRRADPQTFSRLYEQAAQLRNKKQKDIEESEAKFSQKSVMSSSKGTAQEVFQRLHEKSKQQEVKLMNARILSQVQQEEERKAASIHKNAVGDEQVFERLYVMKAPRNVETEIDSSFSTSDAARGPITTPRAGGRKNGEMLTSPDSGGSKFTRNSNGALAPNGYPAIGSKASDFSGPVKYSLSNVMGAGDSEPMPTESLSDSGIQQDGMEVEPLMEDIPAGHSRRLRTGVETTSARKHTTRNKRVFGQCPQDEVRNRILEEEWSKRPTEVRTRVVASLQSKGRPT